MEVRFRKTNDGRNCTWEALRPPRTRVPGPSMAAGGDIPHDLATFVIEDALGIEFGFWGCLAAGATFRSLGRKRTPQGVEVIRRHTADLVAAERRVNEIYFAWRAGDGTDLDDLLDRTRARWRRLPDDGEIVVSWRHRPTRRSP